jgi:predicted MFS family arabinose efflux permease
MWAIVVPIGTRLVPSTHAGRATAAVYVGTSAALVVGNPLTSSMSQAWGWRPTVAVLAITAAAVTLVALAVLPELPVVDEEDAGPIPRSQRPRYHGRLIVLCGLTLVGVTAHFTSFTFIVPIIRDVVGIGGPDAAWLLVAYGAFGLVAMALLARAIDQRLRTAVAGSLGVLCLAFWLLSVLTVARSGVVATVLGVCAVVVWGASAAALPPMLQSAAMRASAGNVEQASALYVTAFQVGILTGSVTGGLVDQHHGISAVVMVSTALFAVTLAGVVVRGDVFGGQPSSVTVLRS